jgi:hydrogenase maturation factor
VVLNGRGARLRRDQSAPISCCAKSDPITFATDEIGWYAVHVNANDVATTGAQPRWFLATVLLPHTITPDEIDRSSLRRAPR